MESFLFLIVIVYLIWYFWGRHRIRYKRGVNNLSKIRNYSPTHYLIDALGGSISIDPTEKRIAYVSPLGAASLVSFGDITELEVCRNGTSITKTNRGNQLVTTAIGQLLFGDKGFEVGGLTASSTSYERITELTLKVYINDINDPVREIYFYKGPKADVNHAKVCQSGKDLDEWYGRLRAAMANREREMLNLS